MMRLWLRLVNDFRASVISLADTWTSSPTPNRSRTGEKTLPEPAVNSFGCPTAKIADNFLRCHLTIIALLDHAKELGCIEEVSDEGGFWKQRDVQALVKDIGSWNEMIAAFGGKLKDVLGDGVKAAISEYPNFERLEAAGQSQLPPEIEALARLIQLVAKEPGSTAR